MVSRFCRATVSLVLLAFASSLHAQHRLPLTTTDASERIDPTVRASMDTAKTVNVLVLGRTQLLSPIGGLDSFAVRNPTADRRELRTRVIADLERIAAA